MPSLRIKSATGIPSSTCLSAATICSTENRDFLTATSLPPSKVQFAGKLTFTSVRDLRPRSIRQRSSPFVSENHDDVRHLDLVNGGILDEVTAAGSGHREVPR